MSVLIVETEINAAPEICFDSIRAASRESYFAAAGKQKSDDEIALNQIVVFENNFLFFKQKLIVKVTEIDKPRRFTDEMITGNFQSFKHLHEFAPRGDGTLLTDTFSWISPFGAIGKIADKLVLSNYLRKTVTRRNAKLKQIAEAIERQKNCK